MSTDNPDDTRIGDTDASTTTEHETITGVELMWDIDVMEHEHDTYGVTVEALIPQANNTDLRVATDSDYDHAPTQTEVEFHKRSIINMLRDAGVLPSPEPVMADT
jgi:hypothetical protein